MVLFLQDKSMVESMCCFNFTSFVILSGWFKGWQLLWELAVPPSWWVHGSNVHRKQFILLERPYDTECTPPYQHTHIHIKAVDPLPNLSGQVRGGTLLGIVTIALQVFFFCSVTRERFSCVDSCLIVSLLCDMADCQSRGPMQHEPNRRPPTLSGRNGG